MPKIPAERLSEIGRALFVAAGTPPEEAEIVVRHVVNANLAGHDSHGVIQIPTYIERIKVGHIVPGAPWVIVKESPAHTVVDGHWGFGYSVNERAMQLTIEKAEKSNVAAATVFRQGHIGRLSSYTQMAAKAGMIGLITADSGRSPKAVAVARSVASLAPTSPPTSSRRASGRLSITRSNASSNRSRPLLELRSPKYTIASVCGSSPSCWRKAARS